MGPPSEVDEEDTEVETESGAVDTGVNVGTGIHASKRLWRCLQVFWLIKASPAKLGLAKMNPSKTGNAAARILFILDSSVF